MEQRSGVASSPLVAQQPAQGEAPAEDVLAAKRACTRGQHIAKCAQRRSQRPLETFTRERAAPPQEQTTEVQQLSQHSIGVHGVPALLPAAVPLLWSTCVVVGPGGGGAGSSADGAVCQRVSSEVLASLRPCQGPLAHAPHLAGTLAELYGASNPIGNVVMCEAVSSEAFPCLRQCQAPLVHVPHLAGVLAGLRGTAGSSVEGMVCEEPSSGEFERLRLCQGPLLNAPQVGDVLATLMLA
jgi:hypothetical protein